VTAEVDAIGDCVDEDVNVDLMLEVEIDEVVVGELPVIVPLA
jgi:hypothetical protein